MAITCAEARELFTPLVDDALEPAERARVEGHLAACAECRGELERFRRTVSLLHAALPERAPAGFVDRVLVAGRPEPWLRRALRGLFVPWPVKLPAEAAAVVLLGVLAALVYQRSPEQRAEVSRGATPPVVVVPAPAPSVVAPPSTATPSVAGPAPTATPPVAAPAPTPAVPRAAPSPSAGMRPRPPRTPRTDAEEFREPAGRLLEATPPERSGGEQAARPPIPGAARDALDGARAQKRAATNEAPSGAAAAKSTAPVVATVGGRLTVASVGEAVGGLETLVGRLGGGPIQRREESGTTRATFMLPTAAYPSLVDGLRRLGRFEANDTPLPPSGRVRVSIDIRA